MIVTESTSQLLLFMGGLGSLLAFFTGIIFWSVKAQVSSLKQDADHRSKHLQDHIDTKLTEISQDVKAQAQRIDAHERKLQEQKYGQLQLRNEMLERMQQGYVRHTDIDEIKEQIKALFARLDKVIFQKNGGGADG